jgi:hypothetical protein
MKKMQILLMIMVIIVRVYGTTPVMGETGRVDEGETKGWTMTNAQRWQVVPLNVREKIISEVLKDNASILDKAAQIEKRYILLMGEQLGSIVGKTAAKTFILDWCKQNVVEKCECIIWGEVEKDFEKRDMSVVKKGNYLKLFKLECQDAVLFWEPVAATDSDHVTAGMTPGHRFVKDARVIDLSRNEMVTARPTRLTDSWTGCSICYVNNENQKVLVFVLEPKVPSPGHKGTLSIHLKKEKGLLPSMTEIECPRYNDIFDRCPWNTGDCMCIRWDDGDNINNGSR